MSSPNIPSPSEVDGDLDSCWSWVTFLVAEKVTAALCYAFMIALLTYAILVMRTRRHLPETPVFIAVFSWMVILSTVQIMLDLVDLSIGMRIMKTLFQCNLTSSDNAPWLPGTIQIFHAQWAVLAANILVADGVFVYRCYHIWTRDNKVIIVPASLLIATTITTAVVPTGRLDERVALALALATNLVLLTLTVGRILYNSRTMERDFGMSATRNHNKNAMRMVIYSGVFYCATALLVLISGSVGTGNNLAFYISIGAARHVVNIAPIMAVVRIGLVQDKDSNKGATEVYRQSTPAGRHSIASDAESQKGLVAEQARASPMPAQAPMYLPPKVDVELERKVERHLISHG